MFIDKNTVVFWNLVYSHLGKKALTDIAIPLARDNLPGLVSNLTLNPMHEFERNVSGRGAVRQGRDLPYLFGMKIWVILKL